MSVKGREDRERDGRREEGAWSGLDRVWSGGWEEANL